MQLRQGSALRLAEVDEAAEPVSAPMFLLRLEPRHRAFWSNFADLFRRHRQPPLRLISWPAAPRPDIFVSTRWPWGPLAESLVLHFGVLAAVLWLVPLFPHRELVAAHPAYKTEDLIYYSPSEYLPPLDTGNAHISQPQEGKPAYAPQPIISVPPEADNHTQTIVAPPAIKLDHDVALPNIVAWSPTPVAVPMAATTHTDLRVASLSEQVVAPSPEIAPTPQRQAPSWQPSVAAPAPEVKAGLARQTLPAPAPSVVAPAPQVDTATSTRRVGDINIGPSNVVAPAPQLPVGEQRTLATMGRGGMNSGGGPSVAAPPPSVQELGSSRGGAGHVIALSIHPAPPRAAAPIPAGNRRGTFAAGPQGKVDAPGTPDIPSGKGQTSPGGSAAQGSGNGAGNARDGSGAPPGLLVGAAPKDASTSAVTGGNDAGNKLTAGITPPRLASTGHNAAKVVLPENATPMERKVFGGRKFYSMMLNLPNLNSSGGSWVLRFAEMGESKDTGELNGPVATQTSDPAYPIELMRKNVQGTVTLYAVIRADGTVGEVRVLDGVNDRLDEYARAALIRWRFRPATKNGNAVPLEAVVRIPFKPFHFQSSF